MIVVVILLLVAIAAIAMWQYQLSQANALAAQVEMARIASQNRLDLAPYVLVALLIIAVAVVLVVYFRSRQPLAVNDNRTVYLMLPPGETKRTAYKALGTYAALPLAPVERRQEQVTE